MGAFQWVVQHGIFKLALLTSLKMKNRFHFINFVNPYLSALQLGLSVTNEKRSIFPTLWINKFFAIIFRQHGRRSCSRKNTLQTHDVRVNGQEEHFKACIAVTACQYISIQISVTITDNVFIVPSIQGSKVYEFFNSVPRRVWR